MRRRDFAIGLLLASTIGAARAQERTTQHRIAIVIPAGPVTFISEANGGRFLYRAFFEELRRLGDVEGQNLTVERYSGEGRPWGYADLVREVVSRDPEVIVSITNPMTHAVRAVSGTIPIVSIAVDPVASGLVTSVAYPGGNITGVRLFDYETYANLTAAKTLGLTVPPSLLGRADEVIELEDGPALGWIPDDPS